MKTDQKVGMISTALGAAAGVASAYSSSALISVIVAVAGFVATVFLARHLDSQKKIKWILSNGMPSFFLVWIFAWILTFNLIG